MICRAVSRAVLAGVGATLVGVLLAAPAAAHVTVDPQREVQGGYARVAFRVPNESDSATTTKVEVFLPADAPIASVATMVVPGWAVAVATAKPATPVQGHGTQASEVVTKLTWTASPATAIRAGQFQEFPVTLGPLPAREQLVFKTLQTYSDGTVVRWIDEPVAAGAEEPPNPAPVLSLSAKVGGDGAATDRPVATERAAGEKAGSGLGVGLGAAGLAAGLTGLVLGGLAFARTRRAGGTTPTG